MVYAQSRPRGGRVRDEEASKFAERVVFTRRIAKVVKGGRRLRFNALVVVGDGDGSVGAGMGKSLVIPEAVRKGNAIARRGMVKIPLKGSSIPHEITVKLGASIVVIKPARVGTGIIAAGTMRRLTGRGQLGRGEFCENAGYIGISVIGTGASWCFGPNTHHWA